MANIFSKKSASVMAEKRGYASLSDAQKSTIKGLLLAALVLVPEVAFAQTGAGGANFFCYIASYFKGIVGAAALVAILAWAIEHILGVAKLHDIVIKVGVGAAIVIGSATIIANSGLSSGCVI